MSDAPRPGGAGERGSAPWGDQATFDALAATFLALVDSSTAGPKPAGAAGHAAEGVWACAPLDVPDINRVLLPRFADGAPDVEAGIESMEARFGARPHTWWLDPGASPAELVEAVRWVTAPVREEAVPVMSLELAAWVPAPAPAGVAAALATSTADLVAAERLCAMGFGASAEEAEPFGELFGAIADPAAGPLIVAVASLDGSPGASALGVVTGPDVGIYNVATLPTARRRGLAHAAMDAVLAEAVRRGVRRAVLESSPEGHALYQAMGFRDAGEALVLTVVPTRS